MFLEPLPRVFKLDFVVFVLNPKIPTENSPNFFVICWCDEVLLDLIHGSTLLRVDLAFPHLSHNFHPHICPNFSPELPFFPWSSYRSAMIQAPGHPAPDYNNSIHHPVFRLLFTQFCPVPTHTSAYHHRFPQAPARSSLPPMTILTHFGL